MVVGKTSKKGDLGIKWPQRHSLIFEGQTRVDMRYVCPKGAKNMLVQQARSAYWKKWAAKHEYEELKEHTWLEPALALMRKKMKEKWTEKHRNVAGKLFLEGGWLQKRLFDIGWSDDRKCLACHKEEGTEKHRLYHCPDWYKVRLGDPRSISESGNKIQEPQRRSGSGKEVSSSTLQVKANGTGALQ